LQSSKFTATVEAFFKRHKDDLEKTPYSLFVKECPRVNISDATYYSWRRKAMNLPPYGAQPIRKYKTAARQRLYKQFFSVAKKDTSNEAIALLCKFLERMNSSNHNSRFELIEYNIITDDKNEAMVEVREYK
jgi:hypothetical protein